MLLWHRRGSDQARCDHSLRPDCFVALNVFRFTCERSLNVKPEKRNALIHCAVRENSIMQARFQFYDHQERPIS